MKNHLRQRLTQLRNSIDPVVRKEAEQSAYDTLNELKGTILSYVPIQGELSISGLNDQLASNNRLVLSKISGEDLILYYVENVQNQLVEGPFGLKEPDPQMCRLAPLEDVSVALVPGLGFDQQNHRLGYGKGYYDRLLPHLTNAELIGIGFKQQMLESPLPTETHDHPLDRLLLF